MLSDRDLAALVNHRFPGGSYTIEHWENFLLTDCTGRGPMDGSLIVSGTAVVAVDNLRSITT